MAQGSEMHSKWVPKSMIFVIILDIFFVTFYVQFYFLARQITVLPRRKEAATTTKKKDKARQHKRRPKTRQAQGKTRQTEQNKTSKDKT